MIPIVYLSFAFAFSEFLLMFVKRYKNGAVKTRKDRGSLIFQWLEITIGFTGGFFLC